MAMRVEGIPDDAGMAAIPDARHNRLLEQQAALAALTRSEVLYGEDLAQTWRLVTETAARSMRVERVSLWRYTEDRSAIRCLDLYELGRNRHSAGAELQAALYPAYFRALATNEAIVADDAHTDPCTREFSNTYLTPLGITAMMDTPIHLDGRLEGVLCHEQVGPPVPWTPEDRLFGVGMANLVALALERSERKRLEEERERLNNRWRLVLESAGQIVLSLDNTGVCTFINRSGAASLGYTPEELLGGRAHDLIHHSRSDGSPYPVAECPIYQSFLTGQPVRVEGEVLWRRDGTKFPCEYAANPIINDGIVEGTVVNFVDISERLRSQAELREAKEAAEIANRAKSEFLANMSHELRTPLNSVLGYAQLLLKQSNLSDSQLKALSIIQQSGEHLLGLIEEILDMAKIEAGTLDILADNFDLNRLLDGIATIMRSRAEAKGLVFTRARRSGIPPVVCADECRLRQVLINLLDNAIKYTRSGTVSLNVGPHGGRVRFLVEDTGIGIRHEHQSEIFDVFHRIRDPATAVEGTGLGLAISSRLVQLMGGDLQVASTPGEGSRFWFDLELPAAIAQIPGAEVHTVIGVAGDQRRVLVVEDDEDSRSLLRDFLTALGFEVFEATNGQAGVYEALRLKPDAILMDMRMPGLDGLAATRRIRADPAIKETVIIIISASAFEHNRAPCLAAGADDFLPKPFRQEKLLELLRGHLGLELIYAPDDKTRPCRQPPHDFLAPSAEELHTLLDLARHGDIKNLLDEARRLEARGAEYSPFAVQLRTLAETYQMKKLRHCLTRLGGAV
ncbi:MAG: ATP-binding protein [Gammaproteobacteria bacterium]